MRLPSPITAVACLSRVGILGVIAHPHAAFARTTAEKGLAVVAEVERRDAGFRDSSERVRMTLRTREGGESVRELYSKALEGIDDGDRMLVVFESPPDVGETNRIKGASSGVHDPFTGAWPSSDVNRI